MFLQLSWSELTFDPLALASLGVEGTYSAALLLPMGDSASPSTETMLF